MSQAVHFNSYEPSILSCVGRGSSSEVKEPFQRLSGISGYRKFLLGFRKEQECATHGKIAGLSTDSCVQIL